MPISIGTGVFYEESTTGSGSGNYDAFSRIHNAPIEDGFNTDENGLADNVGGVFTHSLKVADLVKVLIDGVYYYEFRLDLNEVNSRNGAQITLEELQFFSSAAPAVAANYDGVNGTMTGLGAAVYDLTGTLALTDIRSGSGTDDYRFLIPASLFPDESAYLTLYSRFSGTDGGFEEWRALTNPVVNEVAPALTVIKEAAPTVVDEGSAASITYTYTVTSQSAVSDPLSLILKDDNATPGDSSDDFAPTYVSGDTDADGKLDSNETWLFTATRSIPALNAGGTRTNIVTATGTDDEGLVATDTDDAVVTARNVNPSLNIVKTSATTQINEGTTAAVVFTYAVTNTSVAGVFDPLTITSLIDDNGTVGTGDDFTLTYVSGDDGDNLLETGETWNYTATVNVGPFNAGAIHTNVVTVKATDDEGNEATDSDDHTITAKNTDPSIQIVKTSATTEIDEGKVVAVTFTYALTNTSAAGAFDPLTITSLIDDNGTVGIGDDFTLTYVSGDDGDNLLETGETWNYTATVNVGPFNAGQLHTNVVTVKATDDEGNEAKDSDDHTITTRDTDPTINIVKTSATTEIDEGKIVAVTFTYAITNTSAAGAFDPLTITSLVDDNGTPLDNSDDLVLTYVDGDTDSDGKVDAGETWNYTATVNVGPFNAGQLHTNIVRVSAVDDDGNEASDADDHTITTRDTDPTINIVKTSATTQINEGAIAAVTYTYSVTNTSAAGAFDPLTITSLIDDNGTVGTGDDFTLTYVNGDDGDGLLEFGETWNYTATVNVGPLNAGATHTNVVTVTAKDDEGNSTSDTDDHTITGKDLLPTINVVKDANPTLVNEGTPTDITYSYSVTNTSPGGAADPLLLTAMVDDNGTAAVGDDINLLTGFVAGSSYGSFYTGGDTDGDYLIDSTETWAFSYTLVGAVLNAADGLTNIVTVTGKDDEGNSASDTDDATVTGKDVLPGVGIDKVASVSAIQSGVSTPVTFTYTIKNLSTVPTDPLKLLTLVDDMGTATTADDVNLLTAGSLSGDTDNDGLLDLNETWVVTYTTNLTLRRGETRTNVVTVTAEDDEHNPVSDTDDASVYGAWGLTPGFWSNNGSLIWDGNGNTFPKNSSWVGLVPAGQDLAYGIHDLNGDGDTADSGESAVDSNPTTGNRGFLMVGDWNKNGLADANENVLVISRSDALSFLNASTKEQQDGRWMLARDVVAAWLNYLAGAKVGESNDPKSAMHYMDEAIAWLIQTTTDHNHVLSLGDMGTAKVSTSSSAWSQGFSFDGDSILGENQVPTAGNHDIGYDYGTSTNTGLDVMAGSLLHSGLDHFNNAGLIL